ncbi:unnamed protein product [Camellia sinensis]
MASIRRAMSPVPRPGSLVNGEACSVASPLSKSSSCTQNYPPAVGLLLGLFSRRSSRPLERLKPKGQVWRRSLILCFVCFVVGVFFGLTPFASINLSVNLMSEHQALSLKVDVPHEKVQLFDVVPRNVTPLVDSSAVNDNATLVPHEMKLELQNGTSDDTLVAQSLTQDMNTTFHKLLIIVTPSFARPFQAYYLNRLAHTLKLIPPPLLWIVVEMGSQSPETADILRRNGGVMYRHLVCNKNLTDIKDRAVHQRNVALSHIETHRLDGIVYFADDYNIYSVDLFEQMRQIRLFVGWFGAPFCLNRGVNGLFKTKALKQLHVSTCRRFGTWMVAKLMESNSRALLEGPICNGTRVIGWHTNEVTRSRRFQRFHAEMSGFAFNSTILWDPKRWHRPTVEPIRLLDIVNGGFQVSTFIEQVVEDESQMECLPQNCSRIMLNDEGRIGEGSRHALPIYNLQSNRLLPALNTHAIITLADMSFITIALRLLLRFGTWMVAKLMESNSRALLEGPICNGTQVIGWHTNEVTRSRRFLRFHAEMSGFAFNSTILWDPKRWHRPTVEPIRLPDIVNGGFQVSTFIEQVVEDESQMECLPQNCSRIMGRIGEGSRHALPIYNLQSNRLLPALNTHAIITLADMSFITIALRVSTDNLLFYYFSH